MNKKPKSTAATSLSAPATPPAPAPKPVNPSLAVSYDRQREMEKELFNLSRVVQDCTEEVEAAESAWRVRQWSLNTARLKLAAATTKYAAAFGTGGGK